MTRRFTWPVSWLVAAAWYVLVVADALQAVRVELLKRKRYAAH